MKTIIIALLMLASHQSISQPLFGYTPAEIMERYPNMDWEYRKWGEDQQKMTMGFITPDIMVVYFFDEENLSKYTTIAPQTQEELQNYIRKYNKRYVSIDPYTWKFYDEGTIFLCKLKQTDDGDYFFLWSVYY